MPKPNQPLPEPDAATILLVIAALILLPLLVTGFLSQ